MPAAPQPHQDAGRDSIRDANTDAPSQLCCPGKRIAFLPPTPVILSSVALALPQAIGRAVQRAIARRARAARLKHKPACPLAVAAADDPVVACGGGGIYFFWQLGAARALVRHRARLERDQEVGGDVADTGRSESGAFFLAGGDLEGGDVGAGGMYDGLVDGGGDGGERDDSVFSDATAKTGDERARLPLPELNWAGSSAGALCAVLSVCEVDPEAAVRKAHDLARAAGVYERPAGLAGIWGRLIYDWLEALLPADAHLRCDGCVTIHLSVFCGWRRGLRVERVNSFASRTEVIECLMGSVHLPWFLDGRTWRKLIVKEKVELVCDGGAAKWFWFCRDRSVTETDVLVRAAHAPHRDPDFFISHMDDEEYLENSPGFTELVSADAAVDMVNRGFSFMEKTLLEGEITTSTSSK